MAHCLVRNEERWIWYAINSVLDFVDKILVYDTGSTDNTVKIINSIKSPKIIFTEKGEVDAYGMVKLRQEMLEKTGTDWFMILDGDEVWTNDTIAEVFKEMNAAEKGKDTIVVPQWWCLGDVYHFSPNTEKFIHPKVPPGLIGWRSVRVIKTGIEGLHCLGVYPNEGYYDKRGIRISDRPGNHLIFTKNKCFHMSLLPRSSTRLKDREVIKRTRKTHFIKGIPFPGNISYPEVFYKKKPKIVASCWKRFTLVDQLKGYYFRSLNFVERRLGEY